MITSIAWVKKGVAQEKPRKYELSEEEYERICQLTKDNLDLAKDAMDQASKSQKAAMAMQTDSDNDSSGDIEEVEIEEEEMLDSALFSTLNEQQEDDANDPNIIKDAELELEKEEEEEMLLQPSDNLILVGRGDEELSQLEVYVYNFETDDLYVHRDILLPSLPICIEPINYNWENNGLRNFCAVGTFEPHIEIWNLDVVDAMYPFRILGEPSDAAVPMKLKKNKNKKKSKSEPVEIVGHTDAVLALSWNKIAPNFLLSASADKRILLWNLDTGKVVQSYDDHKDKVSCVEFHNQDQSTATIFASGGYGKKVHVYDARNTTPIESFSVGNEVESLCWDPHNPSGLLVGCENGVISYYEVSSLKKDESKSVSKNPVFSFHSSHGITSLECHPFIPGLVIATSGTKDSPVSVYDISSGVPKLVCNKDANCGKVFAGSACPDEAYVTALGGSDGILAVWNITDTEHLCKTFEGRDSKFGKVKMNLAGAVQRID